jgi:hypothetical protein
LNGALLFGLVRCKNGPDLFNFKFHLHDHHRKSVLVRLYSSAGR